MIKYTCKTIEISWRNFCSIVNELSVDSWGTEHIWIVTTESNNNQNVSCVYPATYQRINDQLLDCKL